MHRIGCRLVGPSSREFVQGLMKQRISDLNFWSMNMQLTLPLKVIHAELRIRSILMLQLYLSGKGKNKYTISHYTKNNISQYIKIWHVGFDSKPNRLKIAFRYLADTNILD